MLRRFTLLVLTLGACKSSQQAGVQVDVTVDPKLPADCIGIAVTPASGVETQSPLVPRKAKVTFGVAGSDTLTGDVTIVARGFLGSCDGGGNLNAQSDAGTANLTPTSSAVNPAPVVNLTLSGALDDFDSDGYRAQSSGGTDCNDTNAAVHPGAMESCANGIDDDCNGLIDCADPVCNGMACNDGQACSTNDTCTSGRCMGVSSQCAFTPDECTLGASCLDDGGCLRSLAAAGAPCDGGTCRADGQCAPSGIETQCANGIDDDGNGHADCADDNCLNQPCDAGNACVPNPTCRADFTCQGGPACTTPPGPCFADAGACVGGACTYDVALNRACDDGNLCTTGDACLGDAGCAGTQVPCTMADDGGCVAPSGECNVSSGMCEYLSRSGACDDGNACTAGDVCTSGVCTGTAFTCDAPPDCRTGGTCLGDGGCHYVPALAGTPCDGGICSGSGVCGVARFPYTPSNFDLSTIPDSGIGGVFSVTCAMSFDSDLLRFMSSCPTASTLTPTTFTQSNGVSTVLVSLAGLDITPTGTLTLTGSRPVIFAIFGDAAVEAGGSVLANSTAASLGAGGVGPYATGAAALCGTRIGGNGRLSGQGVGGGGAGGAFATAGGHGGNDLGGTPGAPDSNAALVPLVGGCPGGVGGGEPAPPALPGSGGGALQISASGAVTISGLISVSGAGGRHGDVDYTGGDGAGSGGGILLEGSQVLLRTAAILTANGGGAGAGAGVGIVANDGQDGAPDTAIPAPGGAATGTSGGDGGAGATVGAGAVAGDQGAAGGGGGGGGVGRLRVNAYTKCLTDAGSLISASFSANCP